uniref:KASH domain-containing protein n=1 Tax=Bursaphelenchus xylophilus TaxID=6326 RepID=A0A1I7SQW3_BURXY
MRRDTVYIPPAGEDVEFRLNSSDDNDSFASDELNDDLENARLPSDPGDEYTYDPLTKMEKIKMKAQRILPHVGLCILLLVYLLVGAAVFQRIEGPNEIIGKVLQVRRSDFL